MSEKFYSLLLRLYPKQFRRTYGEEALRLVLDRARDEKGFLCGLRLWLDLLMDLAVSLPREYNKVPSTRILTAKPASGDPSFQLLTTRSLNPILLLIAGVLTAALFWSGATVVAHSRKFPGNFPADSHSLQAIVQRDVALAQSAAEGEFGAYGFCVTARRDIQSNWLEPLLRFNFAAPGASGAALIDGKIVKTFKNEQHLSISADVAAGNHWFVLRIDRPAQNASISRHRDFSYCRAEGIK